MRKQQQVLNSNCSDLLLLFFVKWDLKSRLLRKYQINGLSNGRVSEKLVSVKTCGKGCPWVVSLYEWVCQVKCVSYFLDTKLCCIFHGEIS